ncbi:MAG: hypothetical protein CHACPFDD_02736 [Phycisphaerae bacterium]|nr:hypothetical protein [Phycisphaerae bacterium]
MAAGRLTLAVLAVMPGVLCGCARQTGTQQFDGLSGVVVETRPEAGEMTIRVSTSRGSGERTFRCMVTQESEIYVDDVLSRLEDVIAGDAVRLLGRRDVSSTSPAIVVSYARIARDGPRPSPPAFLSSAASSRIAAEKE